MKLPKCFFRFWKWLTRTGWAWILTAVILTMAGFSLYSGMSKQEFIDNPAPLYGDWAGGWGSLLAFIWFLVAVSLQREELQEQRAQLQATQREMRQQRSHMELDNLIQANEVCLGILQKAERDLQEMSHYKLGSDVSGYIVNYYSYMERIRSETARERFNQETGDLLRRVNGWKNFLAQAEIIVSIHLGLERNHGRGRQLHDLYKDGCFDEWAKVCTGVAPILKPWQRELEHITEFLRSEENALTAYDQYLRVTRAADTIQGYLGEDKQALARIAKKHLGATPDYILGVIS